MNAETRGFPRGDIRVSDAERDLAVAELSEHFQAGRLTQGEFDERSGQAFQARTWADLSGLFTDLPRQGTVPALPTADPASGPMADPFFGPAELRPPGGGLLVARFVIAAAIAVIAFGGVLGGQGHPRHAAWLIPVVILGLVFLLLARLARRR